MRKKMNEKIIDEMRKIAVSVKTLQAEIARVDPDTKDVTLKKILTYIESIGGINNQSAYLWGVYNGNLPEVRS